MPTTRSAKNLRTTRSAPPLVEPPKKLQRNNISGGGGRSGSSGEENDESLARKLRLGLQLNGGTNNNNTAEKSSNESAPETAKRKLKNITNTVSVVAPVPGKEVIELATRKRRSTGDVTKNDCGEKRRKKGNDINLDSVSESEPISPTVDGRQRLKNVLGAHYFDVVNRLQLDYEPECLRKMSHCAGVHAKRINRAHRMHERRYRDTKELLVENRPDLFLNYLEQALLRREFIDSDLFLRTLELILTMNKPSSLLNADYTVEFVLRKAIDVLDHTVDFFPPCWLDVKQSYLNVLFGSLEEECFLKFDRSEGLFRLLLVLLERNVEFRSEDFGALTVSRSNSDPRGIASFQLWEQENNLKYDFDQLTREQKLDRLFAVLRVLVKILEMDLAMWTLRHPHKTKENLCSQTRRPLIGSVLWSEHSTVGEVNSLIKRIVQLYINVVAANYPEESIQVISRLVTVIGTVINLSEIQFDDGALDYPCIKNNTRYFVQQITRLMESSAQYSVSLCLRVIEQMRSPLIRMILVEQFLEKLTINTSQSGSGKSSTVSFVRILAKGHWRDYPLINHSSAENSSVDSDDPPTRYPLLKDRKLSKASRKEFTRDQYLNILFQGFSAYTKVYPLPEYFRMLKLFTDGGSPSSSSNKVRNATLKTPPRKVIQAAKYDFLSMERSIAQLMEQRKPDKIIVANRSNSNRLLLEEINVTPDLLDYYRDEVKHLLLMQRWFREKIIRATRQEHREVFKPWMEHLEQIDESLACESASTSSSSFD
ncbi:uncharacterized protein LOC129754646 [Uranotaenia lowii]|uniref:uncharacterized protein LOC129754646 n=1 Tax=Uranotaenia lowii TaxID=190385 RepID=UPI0024798473|nr:uncharacterized protein LOC129754646 [Uranotaenia lowii]